MYKLRYFFGGSTMLATAAVGPTPVSSEVEASETNTKKPRIKLSELPIYDSSDVNQETFVVESEKTSLLRSSIRETRQWIWGYLDSVEGSFTMLKNKFEVAQAHSKDVLSYIHDDSSIIARGAIITVAGLGGVVAGYRGGLMKKAVYSTIAVGAAATVCYPKKAYEFAEIGWKFVEENTSGMVSTQPEIKQEASKPSEASENTSDTEKSLEPHTNEKTLSTIKKDYGMSVPEDKDLYANRSH